MKHPSLTTETMTDDNGKSIVPINILTFAKTEFNRRISSGFFVFRVSRFASKVEGPLPLSPHFTRVNPANPAALSLKPERTAVNQVQHTTAGAWINGLRATTRGI